VIIEHSRLFSVLFVPFVFFVLRFPPAQNQSFNTEVSARRTCNQTQLQCLKRTERNFTSARLKPNPPSRSGNSARGATKVRISNTHIRREKGLSRAFTGGFAVSESNPGYIRTRVRLEGFQPGEVQGDSAGRSTRPGAETVFAGYLHESRVSCGQIGPPPKSWDCPTLAAYETRL